MTLGVFCMNVQAKSLVYENVGPPFWAAFEQEKGWRREREVLESESSLESGSEQPEHY